MSLVSLTTFADNEVVLYVDNTVENDDTERQDGATYKTIQGAIAKSQNNDIIQLLTDIETDEEITFNFQGVSKTLTLDLNGKTITSTYEKNIGGALEVKAYADVTVKNGTIISNNTLTVIFSGDYSDIVIENMTLTNTADGLYSFYAHALISSMIIRGETNFTGKIINESSTINYIIEDGTYNFDPIAYVDYDKYDIIQEDDLYKVELKKYDVKVQTKDNFGVATLKIDNEEETTEAKAIENASIVFSTTPNEGYEFDCWEIITGNIDLEDNKTNPLTVQMPKEDLTLEARFLKIYDYKQGDKIIININDQENVLFIVDGEYEKLVKVLIDGNEVANSSNLDNEKCKVEQGSISTILKYDYLSTLENGQHTLSIILTDGKADTTFTIIRKSNPTPGHIIPHTGIN